MKTSMKQLTALAVVVGLTLLALPLVAEAGEVTWIGENDLELMNAINAGMSVKDPDMICSTETRNWVGRYLLCSVVDNDLNRSLITNTSCLAKDGLIFCARFLPDTRVPDGTTVI